MATDRELYEEMYARQLAEGATLEQAMRSNRASTPEDYRRACGNSDDPHQQWRKIGGGNKMGSAGASINAKRKAQKQARDARGESDPIVSRITAFVDKLAGKEASDDSTTERTSDYRTPKERRNRERMAGDEVSSVFGTSTLDGTLMASHDKAFSKYPAAAGPDRWPGLPPDKLHYLHPSRDPLTNILSTPFGIKGA